MCVARLVAVKHTIAIEEHCGAPALGPEDPIRGSVIVRHPDIDEKALGQARPRVFALASRQGRYRLPARLGGGDRAAGRRREMIRALVAGGRGGIAGGRTSSRARADRNTQAGADHSCGAADARERRARSVVPAAMPGNHIRTRKRH